MSSNLSINTPNKSAPTPQNTPLTRDAPIHGGLAARPAVPDIAEAAEEVEAEQKSANAKAAGALSGVLRTEAGRNVLSEIVQGRLNALVGKSSGYIEKLPVEQKRTLAALQGLQGKHGDLMKQYRNEIWELEKKYLELSKPLCERRAAIVAGSEVPTTEEIDAGEKELAEDNEEYQPLPKDNTACSAIPEFWLTALRNHLGISTFITERDESALRHLTDVRVSYIMSEDDAEGRRGFKLTFMFSPNEFFDNDTLVKTYYYLPEIDWEGDFVYDRAVGTEIQWKEDKDLTKEVQVKKQRNKSTNRTRLVRKSQPADSFFNFFIPPQPPSEDPTDEDILDEEEFEELESRMQIDYQIGEDFKDKIIPHAVEYFTGKALQFDEDSDWDDGEDEDDDDIQGISMDEGDDDDDEE